ncbi:site-specific DNA recombinase [Rhodococcus jostii]|uniref:Site-specific DNA recombinase n=1 Tax=Rhodococcus jostii TaxID=132919 RepID=A0A1H4R4N9_RHOJO|nr:site-specific DNA recombinase [Rhodococcus jostii]
MTSAVIYARVSSARQKKDETIRSQTAALRAHAEQLGLEVPDEWVFEDEGHSGATLIRPALERLRDLVAGVGVDVVLCYSPDRLARKFAYQALLIEEFTRAGTRVQFVQGPRGDSPEDQLLVQFQGMFAEYEKAQILERYRRGKTHRAKTGSINVLSGAPFGYRYVRKSDHAGAAYEVVEHESVLVTELFRRYADDGASIAELARWLTEQGVPTRTGKQRWDRSVLWGMLRNPAYAGRAVFGKTMVVHESPGLNRVARLQGRSTPRASKTVDRPRDQWTEIAVPAIVTDETFDRVARRLADNKRFASRNSKTPSLLQGLAACSGCGYGYYRTSTRTTNKKIYYYRCLGSDDYRYEGGRVCTNKPVRADYLDTVVWDHITGMLANPQLIRTEIDKRLDSARTSDPAAKERKRLETALAKASTGITRMIEAFGEQLITIDELRARMPDLRARETNLHNQIEALDTQLADREAYLKLASDLEGFLTQLHTKAEISTVGERQRVLRLLVKDVLIGPDKITIRHRIPIRERTTDDAQHAGNTDTEGDHPSHCPLRWGRKYAALGRAGLGVPDRSVGGHDARLQKRLDQGQNALVDDPRTDPFHDRGMGQLVETRRDIGLEYPVMIPGSESVNLGDRVLSATPRAETVTDRFEVRLEDRLQHQQQRRLHGAVHRGGDTEPPEFAAPRLRNQSFRHRQRSKGPRLHLVSNLPQEYHRLGVSRDGCWCQPVDTGRPCALVAPHPVPRDGEKIRVVDEIEHIIKEAVGIVDRPVVQLALHLSYPPRRPIGIGP